MSATDRQHAPPLPRLRRLAVLLLPLAFWAVVLGAAASVVTERALPFALLLAVVALAVRWVALAAPSVRTSLDLPAAGLAAMGALSLAITPVPDVTATQLARLLVGIALCYAVANWARSPAHRRLAALGLAGLGLALAAGALISVRWETYKLTFLPAALYSAIPPRLADTVNPNVMAGYLALLLPALAGPLLFAWRSISLPARITGAAVVVAMAVVLLLTQSRGGLLAAAVAFVILGLLRWNRLRPALGLILVAGLAALLMPPVGAAALGEGTLVGGPERAEIYRSGLAMARDHWLLGVGLGAFPELLLAGYPLVLHPEGVPHAHNLPLQLLIDLGLSGLLAWAGAVVAVVIAARRALGLHRAAGDTLAVGLAAGLLAAQGALLAHGALDAVTWGMVKPAVIVWGLWGLAMALAAPQPAEETVP